MIFMFKFDFDQMINLMFKVMSFMGVLIFYICFFGDIWFDKDLISYMWFFVFGFVLFLVEIYVQF